LAATAPATADTALAIIREKVAKAKNEYVSDEELVMGKRNVIVMEDVSYSQTTADQSYFAAQYELLGLGYNWRDSLREKIAAVTKEDVRRVAQKYLTDSATLVIKPSN
jgi:predicted Zn-dependent peptidase